MRSGGEMDLALAGIFRSLGNGFHVKLRVTLVPAQISSLD